MVGHIEQIRPWRPGGRAWQDGLRMRERSTRLRSLSAGCRRLGPLVTGVRRRVMRQHLGVRGQRECGQSMADHGRLLRVATYGVRRDPAPARPPAYSRSLACMATAQLGTDLSGRRSWLSVRAMQRLVRQRNVAPWPWTGRVTGTTMATSGKTMAISEVWSFAPQCHGHVGATAGCVGSDADGLAADTRSLRAGLGAERGGEGRASVLGSMNVGRRTVRM